MEIFKLILETLGEGAIGGVVGASGMYFLVIQQRIEKKIKDAIDEQTKHIDKRFDDMKTYIK